MTKAMRKKVTIQVKGNAKNEISASTSAFTLGLALEVWTAVKVSSKRKRDEAVPPARLPRWRDA